MWLYFKLSRDRLGFSISTLSGSPFILCILFYVEYSLTNPVSNDLDVPLIHVEVPVFVYVCVNTLKVRHYVIIFHAFIKLFHLMRTFTNAGRVRINKTVLYGLVGCVYTGSHHTHCILCNTVVYLTFLIKEHLLLTIKRIF